jgi:hypothetical protein
MYRYAPHATKSIGLIVKHVLRFDSIPIVTSSSCCRIRLYGNQGAAGGGVRMPGLSTVAARVPGHATARGLRPALSTWHQS